MPQARRYRRQRYAAGQQVRTVRVPKGVQARAFRQLKSAEQQGHGPGSQFISLGDSEEIGVTATRNDSSDCRAHSPSGRLGQNSPTPECLVQTVSYGMALNRHISRGRSELGGQWREEIQLPGF
jgi:hypothetical protein